MTGPRKPIGLFDREREWRDLLDFATSDLPGLRLAVVRGRRRVGKSFLLRHLTREVGGVYTLALDQSRALALDQFIRGVEAGTGARLGSFTDWAAALDAAMTALARLQGEHPPLLVVDEFPYLVAHSPELPSVLQALYDERGPASGHPALRVVLCGSAISVMSTLLQGGNALRGRAMYDMRVGPFRHRDSAAFWHLGPERALLTDAVLGGSPGYRELVDGPPSDAATGFTEWMARYLLNPSRVLFSEPDFLLSEEPRVTDRSMHHSIWNAVASGAATPTQIGGLVGMDAGSLAYHLGFMRDAGFIRYEQDLLHQRKPVITVADPIVRFHHLIVRPHLARLEQGDAESVLATTTPTFTSKILGPHFEYLARQWTYWHGAEHGLDDVREVGTSTIACREHRGHEIDVVAIARDSAPRTRGARITVLGEAKATTKPRGTADLDRLEHIRDLVLALGYDTTDARLVLYSRTGFTKDLATHAAARRAVLVNLDAIYGRT
jgi:hypothetical protein